VREVKWPSSLLLSLTAKDHSLSLLGALGAPTLRHTPVSAARTVGAPLACACAAPLERRPPPAQTPRTVVLGVASGLHAAHTRCENEHSPAGQREIGASQRSSSLNRQKDTGRPSLGVSTPPKFHRATSRSSDGMDRRQRSPPSFEHTCKVADGRTRVTVNWLRRVADRPDNSDAGFRPLRPFTLIASSGWRSDADNPLHFHTRVGQIPVTIHNIINECQYK
jgi:hypothetical protein